MIISSHPNFYSVPETHYFTLIFPEARRDWSRRLTKAECERAFRRLALPKPGLSLSPSQLTDILARLQRGNGRARDLLDLLIRHLGGLAENQDKSWVEKTPRHATRLEAIAENFPEASVVAIIRDPRDCASSLIGRHAATGWLARARYCWRTARTWSHCVDGVAASPLPTHVVRYEDLVEEADDELARVFVFLKVEPNVGALRSFAGQHAALSLPSESHKALLSDKIIDRRRRYRSVLTVLEIAVVELIVGPRLARWGYQSERPVAWWQRLAIRALPGIFALMHVRDSARYRLRLVRGVEDRGERPA